MHLPVLSLTWKGPTKGQELGIVKAGTAFLESEPRKTDFAGVTCQIWHLPVTFTLGAHEKEWP